MDNYLNAKRNILEYIKDKDKFNQIYTDLNTNIDIIENILNTIYKNSNTVDKELLVSFCNHLRDVLETEKEKS